ncbi:DUF664 domain-containing protein [Kitasatospora sp. NPDC101235]|uniref:mycothiol transferase n=1 Tax=Kitasatospora sp. NPDC101235 TaxID=3364101 RepID=UPI003810C645
MTLSLPEPDQQLSDPSTLLLDYLDYYRSVISAKTEGMSDTELRVSRLPSGWTMLELLKHLVHVTLPPAEAGGFSLTLAGVATGQPGP